MAAGWRYFAQRLTGDGTEGEFIHLDVPLQGVAIDTVLSGHSSMQGTITPEIASLVGADGEPLFEEWGTAVWAENGGEIRGGGILTHSEFTGHAWNLEFTGYSGYLQDLPYTDAWFGVEVDPLDVVRHIWEHAQSKPGGDLGLEISDLKTGLKIGTELKQVEFDTEAGPVSFESGPVKLAWYQTHDLAAEVDRLAEETPFDWVERHWWDGETLRHKIDIGYPRIGRRREDLRFVYGENVFSTPSTRRDGAMYASEAMVLGAGEGRTMKRGTASRNVRRLRRVAVVSEPSLRSLKAVNAAAAAEMARRADIEDVSDFVVRDSRLAPIGSVQVGDEIHLGGRTGWRTLDEWVRVLAINMSPDAANDMTFTVTRSNRLAA